MNKLPLTLTFPPSDYLVAASSAHLNISISAVYINSDFRRVLSENIY